MKKILSLFVVCAMLTLAVFPASASKVGSVEAKSAPTISKVETSSALEGTDTGSITVTAMVDSDELDDESKEVLTNAYNSFTAVDSLVEIAPELKTLLAEVDSSASVDDLVVRDLFNINLPADVEAALHASDDAYITMDFEVNAASDDVMLVMVQCDGENWITVANEDITLSADGKTLTVKFYELCPIAFLSTTAADTSTGDSTDTSVDTGDNSNAVMYGIVAAGCAAVAMGLVVTRKKETK